MAMHQAAATLPPAMDRATVAVSPVEPPTAYLPLEVKTMLLSMVRMAVMPQTTIRYEDKTRNVTKKVVCGSLPRIIWESFNDDSQDSFLWFTLSENHA